MRWSVVIFAAGILFFSSMAPAAAVLQRDLNLGGHFKSLNAVVGSPPLADASSGEFSSNRLRLDMRGSPTRHLHFSLSFENQLLYSDPPGLVSLPRSSPNRVLNLEEEWNSEGRWSDRLLIDRLNLRTTQAGIDWTLGRQAVGFGRISLFSPLDIIAPFPPDALDTEVRPGVDALRASRFFGVSGQISLIAVFGDASRNNSYLMTSEYSWRGIDMLVIGGILRERPMVGFGLAGQIAGMGLKVEATFYEGRDPDQVGGDFHDNFAIAGIECDYRFESGFILFLQYLYNGAGADYPGSYLEAAASAPFQEGLAFLAGRHYLMAGPSYELHPLVHLNGLLIWNLRDDSFLFRPLLDISLSDNLVLQAFWAVNHGRSPAGNGFSVPRSEFGSGPDSGGIFLKYFF